MLATTERISYRLSQDPRQVAQLINAIPDDWHTLCANFRASLNHYGLGIVLPHTRLELGTADGTAIGVFTADDTPYEERREWKASRGWSPHGALLFMGRLPSSILMEGSKDSTLFPFSDMKNLASYFVAQGYKGFISARSSEDIGIHTFSRETVLLQDEKDELHLWWNSEAGGKKQNLEGILAVAQQLELQELPTTK